MNNLCLKKNNTEIDFLSFYPVHVYTHLLLIFFNLIFEDNLHKKVPFKFYSKILNFIIK